MLSCYPPWGNKNHHIPGHGTKPHESSGICSGGLVAQVARRCVDLVIRVDTSEVDRQRSGDLPSMEVSFCLCTHISVYWNIYIYIPGTQMTSIFEGQPPKTRSFSIKTRVIWVPGMYIYILRIYCWYMSHEHNEILSKYMTGCGCWCLLMFEKKSLTGCTSQAKKAPFSTPRPFARKDACLTSNKRSQKIHYTPEN